MEGVDNMLFEIGTVLELDDQKNYTVVSHINYNNKQYLYMIDISDNSNMMFCELQNDELVTVTDIKLLEQLVLLANKDVNSL